MRMTGPKSIALLVVSVCLGLLSAELFVAHFIAVRDVGPPLSQYHPVYGQELKPNFQAVRTTPEFEMQFSTNEYGFRGASPLNLTRGSILFLGDSFTMGYGVNNGEEYPALISRYLRSYLDNPPEIVNAGIGNTGNGRWIRFLRSEAARFNPTIVVYQIFDNDLYDNIRESFFMLGDDGLLIENPMPERSFPRRLQDVLERVPIIAESHVFGLMRQVRWSHQTLETDIRIDNGGLRNSSTYAEQLQLALVDSALREIRSNGWSAILLIVGIEDRSHRSALVALSEELGAWPILMESKAMAPSLFYDVDGHWNAQGHVEAAEVLIEPITTLMLEQEAHVREDRRT